MLRSGPGQLIALATFPGVIVHEAASFNLLAIVSFPLVWAVYMANLLRFFWLDYLYGIGIGLGLPALVF